MDSRLRAVSLALFCPLFGVVFVFLKAYQVMSKSPGPEGSEQVFISAAIMEGSYAFMWRQYKIISYFIIVCLVLILAFLREPIDPYQGHHGGVNANVPYWQMAVHFLVGSVLSCLSGVVGMNVAIRANVRTTEACKDNESGLNKGLRVAFDSGSVMGMTVVCFVVFGQGILFLIFDDPLALSGFGFGASIVALFARVGGGIFTKAADVGSDLVGKVESGLPEDDPRNPGVIADNVGDNVGDVAGLGADLFESYVGATVAAVPLGSLAAGLSGIALPFWISGMGIIASLVGTFAIRTKNDATAKDLLHALHLGTYVSTFLVVVLSIPICYYLFENDTTLGMELYGCIMIGLFAGVLVGYATEYTTSDAYFPTRSIALSAHTGPATVIITGLGVGMISTMAPGLILAFAALGCSILQGAYGVSIAAIGMLSTLGITLATDAYGPVADNAGGIAEMAGLPAEVRVKTDKLDALGNTTAATGKGFAIGSALLITLALISAFVNETENDEGGKVVLDFSDAYVLSGALVGSLLPFVFAALTMFAVGHSAQALIVEVRRQFRDIKGLREGRPGVKPDNRACVEICTTAALKEMILPGFLAVMTPLAFGFTFGSKFLGGVLVGSILTGFFLATTMANSGGAWDNAKKFIEADQAKLFAQFPKFNGDLPQDVFLPHHAPDWTNEHILIWARAAGFETWAPLFQKAQVTGANLFIKKSEHVGQWGIKDIGVQKLIFAKINELHMAKRSLYHDATVIGDTVGDPFKDTSGPALNILSKLMSHLSLIISGKLAIETGNWQIGVVVWIVSLVSFFLYYKCCHGSRAFEEDLIEEGHEFKLLIGDE
eukprot:gb/GEZN01001844.1/.p1 GENE.gb/GEZN01001844.1/~~gb/GEZN01001844.1/.p1  ORF type:complete len:888 (+),score=108.62 gb/GEZN01001844.1/:166-2664(+)